MGILKLRLGSFPPILITDRLISHAALAWLAFK